MGMPNTIFPQEFANRRAFSRVFALFMWLSVAAALATYAIRPVGVHQNFLLAASACFLISAVLGGAFSSAYGRLVFAGLVLCALGDFLGLQNFVLGATAFLFAHMFFIAAFWMMGMDWGRALRFVPLMLVVDAVLLLWLHGGIRPGDQTIAYAYVAVISIMVVFAVGAEAGPRRKLVLVAAFLFYISDIFVAVWRFTGTGDINAYFCYPLYYTACIFFAWTACVCHDEPRVPNGLAF
jgi:uncharacterized membrane protein YhhN